jgi:prepilin-type N-terminal cleavage/methylation domain-containing protein
MLRSAQSCEIAGSGFTLVELLATLAVVTLVIAVAVPTITAYSRQSLRGKCRAAVIAYVQAQESYYQDARRFYQKYPGSVSDEPMGWSAANRPDQPENYRYPALGVEFPRDSHVGFLIQVYEVRLPDLYWERLDLRLRTGADPDRQSQTQTLYAYTRENREASGGWGVPLGWNTNGRWVAANYFWFDIQGCPKFTACR